MQAGHPGAKSARAVISEISVISVKTEIYFRFFFSEKEVDFFIIGKSAQIVDYARVVGARKATLLQ